MDKNIKPEYIVQSFSSYESLSSSAAELVKHTMENTISTRPLFTFVLAGGNTPKLMYSMLASIIDEWKKVHLFWGDERFVPHTHKESNYKMVKESLISKIDIPGSNIHPIPTEAISPEKSALLYENDIRSFFNSSRFLDFRFDCTILGIGEDGHTASLFPGSPALKEKKRWVVDTTAPENYSVRKRITLTLPIINRSRSILFLVSGEKKRPVIEAMLNPDSIKYPAQLVEGYEKTYIYTDIKIKHL